MGFVADGPHKDFPVLNLARQGCPQVTERSAARSRSAISEHDHAQRSGGGGLGQGIAPSPQTSAKRRKKAAMRLPSRADPQTFRFSVEVAARDCRRDRPFLDL